MHVLQVNGAVIYIFIEPSIGVEGGDRDRKTTYNPPRLRGASPHLFTLSHLHPVSVEAYSYSSYGVILHALPL